MQQGINIEAIKQYNNSLREYKEKSAKLQAEIEFSQKELERQCQELSAELGIEVTSDNIESILNEKVDKINKTIAIGTEILERIKAEENAVAQASQQVQSTVAPGNPGVTEMPNSAQNTGAPGVAGVPTPPVMPNFSGVGQAAQPQVIQPTPGEVSSPFNAMTGDLPPIFSRGL